MKKTAVSKQPKRFIWSVENKPRTRQMASMKSSDSSGQSAQSKDGE